MVTKLGITGKKDFSQEDVAKLEVYFLACPPGTKATAEKKPAKQTDPRNIRLTCHSSSNSTDINLTWDIDLTEQAVLALWSTVLELNEVQMSDPFQPNNKLITN